MSTKAKYTNIIVLVFLAVVIAANYMMGISLKSFVVRDISPTDTVNNTMPSLPTTLPMKKEEGGRARIAIMSSFVPNRPKNSDQPPPRLGDVYLEHIINKACYSYIWGYDFIFNTTYGFDDSYPKWHWLDFGTWHRVPHVNSRIRDYDWILYTDTDFLINDIMRPLESFLHEFALANKTNVHLVVPVDNYSNSMFMFSAFAFLIRNSSYGQDILKYWDQFARGVCPKGNLNKTNSGKLPYYSCAQYEVSAI